MGFVCTVVEYQTERNRRLDNRLSLEPRLIVRGIKEKRRYTQRLAERQRLEAAQRSALEAGRAREAALAQAQASASAELAVQRQRASATEIRLSDRTAELAAAAAERDALRGEYAALQARFHEAREVEEEAGGGGEPLFDLGDDDDDDASPGGGGWLESLGPGPAVQGAKLRGGEGGEGAPEPTASRPLPDEYVKLLEIVAEARVRLLAASSFSPDLIEEYSRYLGLVRDIADPLDTAEACRRGLGEYAHRASRDWVAALKLTYPWNERVVSTWGTSVETAPR